MQVLTCSHSRPPPARSLTQYTQYTSAYACGTRQAACLREHRACVWALMHAVWATAAAIGSSIGYTYDPSAPTPMLGGNNLPLVGQIPTCGTADQTSREARLDVVYFESEPMAQVTASRNSYFGTVSSEAADVPCSTPPCSGASARSCT